VAAGAIAAGFLSQMGIQVQAYTRAIGPVEISEARFDPALILTLPTAMPDAEANEKALAYMKECMAAGDSSGGVIECRITGMPAGIGDPVFHKLDAALAAAVMSIGAVKAVEIGDGVRAARARGSENNDAFCLDAEGRTVKKTNHAGGILGGISDGSDVILRAHIKPTPSISREQETVDEDGRPRKLFIKGRHDPVVVPRAVVVVECMAALTILDAMLVNMTARAENVLAFYS
jgi:chorismate synthase